MKPTKFIYSEGGYYQCYNKNKNFLQEITTFYGLFPKWNLNVLIRKKFRFIHFKEIVL